MFLHGINMRTRKGFTLIELLVVISIIGILASLLFVNYTRSQRQALDTQRKSDLNQYRIALENYANAKGGLYPTRNVSNCADVDLCEGPAPLLPYIGTCPKDPRHVCPPAATYHVYDYAPSVTGNKYHLYVWGGLETETGKTWVVCWDGKVGLVDNTVSAINAYCPL